MAGGVAHRAKAPLLQPGDGAAIAVGDGPQVLVDPPDQLIDVEALPLGLAVSAAVVPVGAPPAAVVVLGDVGHDHDQRPAGGGWLGTAEVGPVGRAAAG